MQLVQAIDASRLSGLTGHQLREWCARRAVITPDIPGAGRGRHALFSWQTVLLLRILREMNERFGVEVGAWTGAMAELRLLLAGRSFPGLWRAVAAFPDCDHARLIEERVATADATLMLPLAPHLKVLAHGFTLPADPQLQLFPAVGLRR